MEEVKILFEDDNLIVIDKPSGLTVNRSDTTTGEMTLQDIIEEKYKDLFENIDKFENEFLSRGGIVHRLDKETSGVMIIAKNPQVFYAMQKQFKDRSVSKIYTALVHGYVNPKQGEINVPVGRLPWNRTRFGVVSGGREAQTFYKVMQQFKKNNRELTLLELTPKTGRTHQIRVHLKHLGHPIVSDTLYAGRKTARSDRRDLSRLFLHAKSISFKHPVTQENMTIRSQLPKELEEYLG